MAGSRRSVFLAKLLKRLYGETSSSSLVHTSSRKEEGVLENLGSKSKEKNLDNVQISSTYASTSTNTPCESFQENSATCNVVKLKLSYNGAEEFWECEVSEGKL